MDTPTTVSAATPTLENPKASPEANAALSAALETKGPAQEDGNAAPTPEPKESASQAFSAIAKERKKALELQKRIKDQETKIAEREKRLSEMEAKYSKKPGSPLEALEQFGFTYNDLVEYQLNGNQLTAEQKLKMLEDKVEKGFQTQEEKEKQAAEEQKRQAEEAETKAVSEFKESISHFVSENAETYELISLYDQHELVYATIAQAFDEAQKRYAETRDPKDRPRVLSVKEGADLVEKYLEEMAEKSLKTKRFQSKFTPKSEETTPKEGQSGSKTLASAVTTSSAPSRNPARSEAERMQRAIEALERMGK